MSDTLKVISPIDGTPAARAGLKSGDVIVAVDGKPLEAGGDGHLMAEVARQSDHLHPAVFRRPREEHLERPVAAAVVDDDNLALAGQVVHEGGDFPAQHRQDFLLVVRRDDQ